MARFSDNPAASALTGSEVIPATQGGSDVKTTPLDIANLFKGTKGADIASATTTDIGAATGILVHITGTTTITGLGTAAAGALRIVRFAGALTLTHNATALILPRGGGNIVTAANDCAIFESEGSGNWRCVDYQRANGQPLSNAVTAISSSAGVLNIDCALGDYFTTTLTENVTSLTFSNLPPTGSGRSIMLRITNHASSPKSFTFPSSFKWPGGTAGVISSTNSAVDVLAITSFDQGTRWEATLAKAFA
jgi:hypothetical protein